MERLFTSVSFLCFSATKIPILNGTYLICPAPPAKLPKTTLHFQREDGTRFSVSLDPSITIQKLKQEVSTEEKIDVNQLKIVATQEDADGDELVNMVMLADDSVVSELELEEEIILINGM